MIDILVLYYSRHGSTAKLAQAIASGIESAGCRARVRTVPPIRDYQSHEIQTVPDDGPPFVSTRDLQECSGLALGSPTRFGNMAAPLKAFIDSTSDSWLKGHLIDKPCCVFTSTSSMHGGQESTLLSMMLPLLHHGMLACGLPYSEPGLHETTTGGTPYGATHVAGNNVNTLSSHENDLAQAQGKRLALIARKLLQDPSQ
ncbi:NAD(P)H:quinone oxidoreductase [Alteromonas lipotrueiana]|uniref:NAD(P)H:quinone oxidoreductase n=1 Tax=Alteromonas lipotrueiana TaxID=2803815 RepID=UPI001C455E07|nr:NAD(P)H:quinone oxidoreductase [Alteromonas lipotrueiana]